LSVSLEKQVDVIVTKKGRIVELTSELLRTTAESEASESLSAGQVATTKQLLTQIISELTTIASFISSKDAKWSKSMVDISAHLCANVHRELTPVLEDYCLLINSITVDFTKTPFRFRREFKRKLKRFDAKYKTTLIRHGLFD
jgi:hypothetical protein